MAPVFHLSFHVDSLDAARRFYGGALGCAQGRSAPTWVDFDFFGHQLSLHLGEAPLPTLTGLVGEHKVPMPHFGVVLPMPEWSALAERLRSHDVPFVLEPHVRFPGEPGEQGTMFVADPCGNALEFKGFDDAAGLFSK